MSADVTNDTQMSLALKMVNRAQAELGTHLSIELIEATLKALHTDQAVNSKQVRESILKILENQG
tara:strand:- start:228 stop:422 length:195 start_codon:yes stop_codon:yes gene_type:complete